MGLHVNVYRNADGRDCTINGISSNHKSLTVVNVDGPFEPTDDAPAVLLESHLNGAIRIVPAVWNSEKGQWEADKRWMMFGGNFASTSDSRFARKCEDLLGVRIFYGAVAIHDRFEG